MVRTPTAKASSKTSASTVTTQTVYCPVSSDQQDTRLVKGKHVCTFCGAHDHQASVAATIAKNETVTVPTGTFKSEDRKGMSFQYEVEEFPESTRKGKEPVVNPHTSGVAQAVKMKTEGSTKGLALSIPNEEAEINRHKAWLRTAGAAAGVTIRIEQKDVDEKTVKLVFRAVEKITRTRKASITPDVPEVATPAQTGF